MIVRHTYALCIAKTDQAAQMHRSCYGYTSAQPYRGMHICTQIPLDSKSAQSERSIPKSCAENSISQLHIKVYNMCRLSAG